MIIRQAPIFVILLTILVLGLITVSFGSPFYFLLTIPLLIVTWVKVYEWIDDQYLDNKIGGWIVSQDVLYIKVIPGPTSNCTVTDMEKFLLLLHGTYGGRTQKDFRVTGKFYEEFSIELHSDGGKVSMYVRMYKNSLGAFISAAKLYFPLVQFVEVDNPLADFPKSWTLAKSRWAEGDFGEFALTASDLYPTRSYSEIPPSKEDYKETPVTQLIDVLEDVEDGDYVLLQWLIRPMDISKSGKKKIWEKELASLRKELSTNASVSVGAGGAINPLTPEEVVILQECERKINSQNFQTKLRFSLFGKEKTGKRYMTPIMAYWKNFATSRQSLAPVFKSWDESGSATWGQFWDTLFWKPEIAKRRDQMYKAALNRSMSAIGEVKYWDLYSLAAILQIPNLYLDRKFVRGSNIMQVGGHLPSKGDSYAGPLTRVSSIDKDRIRPLPQVSGNVTDIAPTYTDTYKDPSQSSILEAEARAAMSEKAQSELSVQIEANQTDLSPQPQYSTTLAKPEPEFSPENLLADDYNEMIYTHEPEPEPIIEMPETFQDDTDNLFKPIDQVTKMQQESNSIHIKQTASSNAPFLQSKIERLKQRRTIASVKKN